MNCRTRERRIQIVQDYLVTPVAHIQLLAGQTKHSDAGQTIENDYYIFQVKQEGTNFNDIIQCGRTVGKEFLALLNHAEVPLFNPLHCNSTTGGTNYKTNNAQKPWNPIAEQLHNAIMWVITIIDAKPGTPIFDNEAIVRKYKYVEPYCSRIRAVNTIIKNSMDGKTLTEKIEELRINNDLKDGLCQFDLLINKLSTETDEDGHLKGTRSYF